MLVQHEHKINLMFAKQIGLKHRGIYVDGLIKSNESNSHIADLFEVLRRYKMELNLCKCTFGVSSEKFLKVMANQ